MSSAKVALTKFHRDEMRALLEIMEEGFDQDGLVIEGSVAHSYHFQSIEEIDAFAAKLNHKRMAGSVEVELTHREANAMWWEFHNRKGIALDNSCRPGDEEGRAASKFQNGMVRIARFFNQE